MKITRFTLLILLLVSVLLPLLNGCSNETEPMEKDPETVVVLSGQEEALSEGTVTGIEFFDSFRWIIVSKPLGIRIHDDQKKMLALLSGHPGTVETIALSVNTENPFIAVGCADGTIRSWNVKKLQEAIQKKASNHILRFDADHENYYRDVHTNQTNGVKVLAVSSTDSKILAAHVSNIKLWETKAEVISPNASNTFSAHDQEVTTLTFSHDGKFFASGSVNKEVRVWDYNDLRTDKLFRKHEDKITALVFLPPGKFLNMEGTFLASGGKDAQIILWNKESKEAESVATLSVDGEVTALTFLANSKLLVSGTDQGEIYFWKMTISDPTERRSKPLEEHKSSITALASSTEDTILISGDADGVVRISYETDILGLFK